MSLRAAEASGVRRAAVLIELADGTRMLYEFAEGSPITLDLSIEEGYEPFTRGFRHYITDMPQKLEVSGRFKGGTVWTGDMPTSQPDAAAAHELGAAPLAIEEGNTDDR